MTKTATPKIAALGLARTFQNIALYTGLSTIDNLMAARHIRMKQSSLASMISWGAAQREEVAHREKVEEIIDFLEIAHIRIGDGIPNEVEDNADVVKAYLGQE